LTSGRTGVIQGDTTTPSAFLCDASVVSADCGIVSNALASIDVAMAFNATIVLAEISGFTLSSLWIALAKLAGNICGGTVFSSVDTSEGASCVRSAFILSTSDGVSQVLVRTNFLCGEVGTGGVSRRGAVSAGFERVTNRISIGGSRRAHDFRVTTSNFSSVCDRTDTFNLGEIRRKSLVTQSQVVWNRNTTKSTVASCIGAVVNRRADTSVVHNATTSRVGSVANLNLASVDRALLGNSGADGCGVTSR
jgi:hypothetical protein